MRWLLVQVLKLSVEGDDLLMSGKLFHNLGATTENAPLPLAFKWVHGSEGGD